MGRTERMGTSINLVAENPRPRDGHAICAEPELLQFRDGLRVVRIIVVCHGGVLEIMHVAFVVGLENAMRDQGVCSASRCRRALIAFSDMQGTPFEPFICVSKQSQTEGCRPVAFLM